MNERTEQGVGSLDVYGIPESERLGLIGALVSPLFPAKREVIVPPEMEWRDDPNIRWIRKQPFRQQEKDLGFNPETGKWVERGQYTPGEYGEPEYALENMPLIQALQNLQTAYVRHLIEPGQFERAVNIIKGAPSAIGNALIGQWAAIGTPPGTAARQPVTGEPAYSAVLPPVARAIGGLKSASKALAPKEATEMITPEGISFPVPPPPSPTIMQMTQGSDEPSSLPSEKLMATTPAKAPTKPLYHATFSKNIGNIKKEGFRIFGATTFDPRGQERQPGTFAFTDPTEALRWASKLNREFGEPVSVFKLKGGERWVPDPHPDPHHGSQASFYTQAHVPPEDILGVLDVGSLGGKEGVALLNLRTGLTGREDSAAATRALDLLQKLKNIGGETPPLPSEKLLATTPAKAPAITGATDLTKGTRIRFTEPVFEGSYKKSRFVGNRTIEGTILKDSYGAKRGQHTFTIEVHSAEGYDADTIKPKIRRKGRTVYKNAVVLEQPSNQAELAAEKHARAAVAKDNKYKTWIEEAEDDPYQQVSTLLKLDKIPSDWLADNVEWRARVERLTPSKAPPLPSEELLAKEYVKSIGQSQQYISERTSTNKVAGLVKDPVFDISEGSVNLDLGGGRFGATTKYLEKEGVTNLVLDPASPLEEIGKVLSYLHNVNIKPVDSVTVANVLNVIKEKEGRQSVIQQAYDYVKPGGKSYFQIYEKTGTGKGEETLEDAYQTNMKIESYRPEIESVFGKGNVQLEGKKKNIFIAAKAPEEQLDLFEEAAQIKPQQLTAGSLFDEKKGRRLLIVGCCKTKSKVEGRIPASERYKGPLFTTLNKAGVPEDVDVAVLSAKHGLIRFDTPLEDYNVKMKDGRKDLLKSPEQLARINNTVDGYGEVFVAGGKDYRNFLDEAGIEGKYTTYKDLAGADKVGGIGDQRPIGIGDQRSILAKWLKREKVEKLRPGERVFIKGTTGEFYFDRFLPNGLVRIRDNEQPNPRFIEVQEEKVSSAGYEYAGGGGVNSLAEIARNMTRYANGGGVNSLSETARSMFV